MPAAHLHGNGGNCAEARLGDHSRGAPCAWWPNPSLRKLSLLDRLGLWGMLRWNDRDVTFTASGRSFPLPSSCDGCQAQKSLSISTCTPSFQEAALLESISGREKKELTKDEVGASDTVNLPAQHLTA